MTKSEQIARMLGICWHEFWTEETDDLSNWGNCSHCKKPTWECAKNPDFEGEKNDQGRVQLLRLMMERRDWGEFILSLRELSRSITYPVYQFDLMIKHYILTDGPLVDAVISWLKAVSPPR